MIKELQINELRFLNPYQSPNYKYFDQKVESAEYPQKSKSPKKKTKI